MADTINDALPNEIEEFKTRLNTMEYDIDSVDDELLKIVQDYYNMLEEQFNKEQLIDVSRQIMRIRMLYTASQIKQKGTLKKVDIPEFTTDDQVAELIDMLENLKISDLKQDMKRQMLITEIKRGAYGSGKVDMKNVNAVLHQGRMWNILLGENLDLGEDAALEKKEEAKHEKEHKKEEKKEVKKDTNFLGRFIRSGVGGKSARPKEPELSDLDVYRKRVIDVLVKYKLPTRYEKAILKTSARMALIYTMNNAKYKIKFVNAINGIGNKNAIIVAVIYNKKVEQIKPGELSIKQYKMAAQVEDIIFPVELKEIGTEACLGLKNLKSFNYDSVEKTLKIGDRAFLGSGLQVATLYNISLGQQVFSFCPLRKVSFISNHIDKLNGRPLIGKIVEIDVTAFLNTLMEEVRIPASTSTKFYVGGKQNEVIHQQYGYDMISYANSSISLCYESMDLSKVPSNNNPTHEVVVYVNGKINKNCLRGGKVWENNLDPTTSMASKNVNEILQEFSTDKDLKRGNKAASLSVENKEAAK
ncbi:MAG: hypothetical protein IJS47_05965 [Clostridia bacterium]|nr:hypothetical protein [Clostridia bacterium]